MDGGRDLFDASTRIHSALREATMKRRQFMKLSAAAGLSLLAPMPVMRLRPKNSGGFKGHLDDD